MAGHPPLTVDVVVLAGGTSSRFGTDKMAVLLDSVLDSLPAKVSVVCVGPPRPTRRAPVTWVRESPPLAGPLAAVAAGVAAGRARFVVLVGGDMPQVGLAVPDLLAALLTDGQGSAGDAAAGQNDGAVLVDSDGRDQLLASAWHRDRLSARLAQVVQGLAVDVAVTPGGEPGPGRSPLTGLPLRLLSREATLVRVPDRWGAAHDVDTPADLP
jgi:molybdopterin-guanine dinucleotide biosynthesis protein A